jgi:hypothetical protein
MPTKESKEIGKEIKNAFKVPSEEMVKVITEINRTTENKIADLSKSQKTFLKGFVEKESPLLDKTFKFFKEGKKREKIKAILQAKTMGPVMVKGLSLGLLKFGIGGALGAAKIFDVTEKYQDYVKDADAEKKQEMVNLVDELRSGENPKTMEEIEKTLKKQGVKGFELTAIMKDYSKILDDRMREVVTQGLESKKETNSILSELVEKGVISKGDLKAQEDVKLKVQKAKKKQIPATKVEQKTSDTLQKLTNVTGVVGDENKEKLVEIAQAIDKNRYEIVNVQEYLNLMVDTQKDSNKVAIERATIDDKRLNLEKQVEQNDQLRHLELMKAGEDGGDGKGGLFEGFKGFKTALSSAIPLIKGLGTAGLVAGAAFAGFKIGGEINKGINSMVSFLTGKEGDTFGGWLYDITHPSEDRVEVEAKAGKKTTGVIAEMNELRKTFGSGFQRKLKARGYTGPMTRKSVTEFFESQKKPSLQKEVEKAEATKIKMEKERKQKEMAIFERMSDEDAISAITAKALAEMNINVGGGVSKLDKIPSNSDDLPLAYAAKGGTS